MIKPLLILTPLALLFGSTVIAAPSAENSLQALLDKACQADACIEGYNVKFKQISYQTGRQQLTLFVTLQANQGIDYPIIQNRFEAQLTQSSFTAVCRVKGLARESFDSLSRNEETEGTTEFRSGLSECLQALSQRTESALGR